MSLPNLDLISTTTSHHTSLARAAVTEWRKKNDQTTAIPKRKWQMFLIMKWSNIMDYTMK